MEVIKFNLTREEEKGTATRTYSTNAAAPESSQCLETLLEDAGEWSHHQWTKMAGFVGHTHMPPSIAHGCAQLKIRRVA